MLILIDNYDSFTFNLVQCIGHLLRGTEGLAVFRNDAVTLDEIAAKRPGRLVLSPGPCTPNEAGICNEVVRRFAGRVPILGVCLGHQCIAAAFGATVARADRVMHGKTSPVRHDGRTIFAGVAQPFEAMRYNSLLVRRETLPAGFEVSAWTDSNEVMAIRDEARRIEGVQFHPESFRTPEGPRMIANFLGVPPAMMATLAGWFGLALFVAAALVGVLLTALQLPGTWLIVVAATLYDWQAGWRAIGWQWLLGAAAAALAAEVVETLASAALVSRAGATRRASIGALVGGFVGMLTLSLPLPIIGTIAGGLIGCFAGAFVAELTHPDRARLGAGEQIGVGTRVGLFAALGRLLGLFAKLAAAFAIAGVLVYRAAT